LRICNCAEIATDFSIIIAEASIDAEPTLAISKVELYTTSWCPWCKKARDFFVSRGIDFDDYDVEKDPEAAKRKSELDKGGRGVPFALIDGKGVHGYSEKAYDEALKAGGARAGQSKGR
jgi:glutaredoxin